MAVKFFISAILWLSVTAAPPAPPRYYQQTVPAQLQQINPYDYYLDNPEVANYYSEAQQKPAASNSPNGAPSRLENLEPDSEVELLPGAQQPQQPPQQNPVSPNLPGLIPGQRVFIVHMPVPGYRPGSVGGYQPVYIVAAGPQTNNGYSPNAINGYQNTLLLDPSGQAVVSPLLGYPRPYPEVQQVNPGYFLAPQFQSLKGPQESRYQEIQHGVYQPAHTLQRVSGAGDLRGAGGAAGAGAGRPVQLAQLIALQTHAASTANTPRNAANESSVKTESKRLAQSRESTETNETEDQRNARPVATRAQESKA